MYNLDFLSESPQLFFFQKESNKKTFEGILFLIYIIIMLILSTIHILNFCLNDKYEIHYSYMYNSDVEKEKLDDNPELNPFVNFSINIYKYNLFNPTVSDRFIVFDENFDMIEQNTTFQMRPSELFFVIALNCSDVNCDSDEEDENEGEDEDDYGDFGYFFELKYQGYKFEHQKSIPLITNDSNIYFVEEYPFTINKLTVYEINWEILKYKENRGIYGLYDTIMKIKNEYTSGYIESDNSVNNDKPIIIDYIKIISIVYMENKHERYTEYQRTKNDILDLIADIGSLYQTFFSIFIFIFKFYSNNVDNYQVINKIISENKVFNLINKQSDKRIIDISQINQNKTNNDKSLSAKSRMLSVNNLISKSNVFKIIRESKVFLESNDKLETNKIIETKENKNIKKLSFKHFFLNSFFLKFFNGKNENKIIDLCNYILSKYTYIDLLLHNQIMFENLLKDYRWNNINLNNINKNELLTRLKNIT